MSITKLFQDHRNKRSKRVGRGPGSTLGKTAGRGTKGQKSRSGSGRKIKQWFEGGQTPLHRRTAKLGGFKHRAVETVEISTAVVNYFYKDGETVSPQTLLEKKVIRPSKLRSPIKVIVTTPLKPKVSFEGVKRTKALSG